MTVHLHPQSSWIANAIVISTAIAAEIALALAILLPRPVV